MQTEMLTDLTPDFVHSAEDAVPGEEVFSYLDLDDEIIELSITPNRADALSMRGVAHEVACLLYTSRCV